MEVQDNMISLEDELFSFDRYFEANSRCVLSAHFGEGKSFFLNEFIKKKCGDCDFITLYPTGYQICDNKDVFEYIKRDILLALLALEPEFLNALDKTNAAIIWESISECRDDIISCLPEINIGVHSAADLTISTANIVNAVRKVVEKRKKKRVFGGNPIKDYFNSFENNSGSLYEFNPISNMISSLISARKKGSESTNSRKVVLVIEDLDRMDPEHIFRILNVFSAHFGDDLDADFSHNKFGFDKVLLLCDYDNIKNIYHHFYGKDADFKGYISKFTPNNIYHYSLRSKFENYLNSLYDKDLRENYLPIANVLTRKILSTSEEGTKVRVNFRVIKSKIKAGLEGLSDEKVLLNKTHNLYARRKNIPLNKILAIAKEFDIDIIQQIMDDVGRNFLNFNEVIKICWPYIVQTRNDILMGYPTIENSQLYRFGFTDDLLWEQNNDEIVRVYFTHGGIVIPIVKAHENIYAYMKEQNKNL